MNINSKVCLFNHPLTQMSMLFAQKHQTMWKCENMYGPRIITISFLFPKSDASCLLDIYSLMPPRLLNMVMSKPWTHYLHTHTWACTHGACSSIWNPFIQWHHYPSGCPGQKSGSYSRFSSSLPTHSHCVLPSFRPKQVSQFNSNVNTNQIFNYINDF